MKNIIANLVIGGALILLWVGFVVYFTIQWSEVQP